jgi:DNA-binding beta-propeller fold protein YncE
MFDPRGKFVMKWGTEGRQDGQVNQPAGLAVDSQDRLYLADLGNSRVQRFVIVETEDGFEANFDGKWGADDLSKPYDVCVDPEDNFYVADFGAHCVYKFSASGHMMWAYGEHGTGEGKLDSPISVAAAANDVVYIADHGNNRIVKIAPTS